MFEVPKIYFYAFWIAAVLHIFCMVKVQTYSVSYMYRAAGALAIRQAKIITRDEDLDLEAARVSLQADIGESVEGLVILQSARLDCRWEWCWPYRKRSERQNP